MAKCEAWVDESTLGEVVSLEALGAAFCVAEESTPFMQDVPGAWRCSYS